MVCPRFSPNAYMCWTNTVGWVVQFSFLSLIAFIIKTDERKKYSMRIHTLPREKSIHSTQRTCVVNIQNKPMKKENDQITK